MSINKYNSETGELVALAGGQQIWIGTQAAHDQAIAAGTMPNNCLVSILDNAEDAQASQVIYDNTDSGLTADNVQNAIDEVNNKTFNIDFGTINTGSVSGGAESSVIVITFNKTFSSVPKVFLTLNDSNGSFADFRVISTTTTNCTFGIRNTSSQDLSWNVNWLAIS